MNFLHYEFNLEPHDLVEVSLDRQANVRLLDPHNYQLYKSGKQHRYYGGLVKQVPAKLSVPKAGHWHVVVDLGDMLGP